MMERYVPYENYKANTKVSANDTIELLIGENYENNFPSWQTKKKAAGIIPAAVISG